MKAKEPGLATKGAQEGPRFLPILLVAAALTTLPAQEAKPADIVEGVAATAKSYLRDITELPLKVTTTTTEFDGRGKLRKTRHDTHRFSIVEARPGRYSARANVGAGAMLFHRDKVYQQLEADMSAVLLGMILQPPTREGLDISVSQAEGAAIIHYHSKGSCKAFEMQDNHLRLTNWCGTGQFVVDSSNFSLQSFRFEAGGLPVADGKTTLRAYSVEETFQLVTMPGSGRPFVAPRILTAVYERDTGRTVMESKYSLLPTKN